MSGNWQNWCRLCAKTDSINSDTVYKMELIGDQLEIVNKYFMISLLPSDGSSSICSICSNFVEKLDDFKNQCIRATEMFKELVEQDDIPDLQAIRLKYGFDSQEMKYNDHLSQVQKEEETKKDDFLDDTYSDPLEQEIDDTVVMKLETPEEEEEYTQPRKKRGRPKKSLDFSKSQKPKSKKEIKCNKNECQDSEEDLKIEEDTSEQIEDDDEPLRKRKRIWKGDGEKKHICSYCSKAFSRQNVMKDHILTKHRKQDMIHVCSQCPKRFATSYRLKIHEAVHLPDDEKLVHPCPYCDKRFSQKVGAEVHINAMHLGEKSFTCEECGKSFSTKGALTEHKITHTEERPCQCSFCPKKFKNQRQLKQHESSHKESGHDCPHCGLKLKSIVTLRMHLLVHSDKKKYKCNYCGNEYKRSKTFKSHLILHTGQRPYECPFCDKTFANGSNCRSHKKKAHPAELAALEASGEQTMTITPKLKYLQPKRTEST